MKYNDASRRMDGKAVTEIIRWWKSLENDRGGRAALRRCGSQLDIMMQPAYHDLLHMEEVDGMDPWPIATIAGILSHVRSNESRRTMAELMGELVNGSPRVSENRFRQLIIRERDEILIPLIRLLPLTERRANIPSICYGVFYWGDHVRKEWVLEYYGMSNRGGEKE